MKTTIDLSEQLLSEARRVAAKENITLRSLVEAGLRSVLASRKQSTKFVLADASVAGNGIRPEFVDAGWAQVRDAIYSTEGTR